MNRTPNDQMKIMKVSELGDIVNLPDFQRSQDHEHIESIYRSIAQSIDKGLEPQLTGCLIIVVTEDQTHFLLDGNHRFHAYKQIYQDHELNLKCYVQVIKVKNTEEAEMLFNQTNNSLPVAKMPVGIKRSDVNAVANYFYEKYKIPTKRSPLFVSTNANRPRVSKVKFEEVLSKIIKNGFTRDEIITRIEKHIIDLNQWNIHRFKQTTSDTSKKLEKWLDTADTLFRCRLGMIKVSTLANLFGIDAPIITHLKQHIPSQLKTRVWDQYYGKDARNGNCMFCSSVISVDNFHCAHNEAESIGGDLSISNLFPCCAGCNLSMGTHTFEEFKNKMRFKID